jgi:LCP family protein required for cell wall assembly
MPSDPPGRNPQARGSASGNSRGRASIPPARNGAQRGSARPMRPSTGDGRSGVQGKKQRGPIWPKITIALGTLLMIAAVGAYALFQTGIHEINAAVKTTSILDNNSSTKPKVSGSEIKGPINILMVGVDASQENTDSIIVAHIPADHKEMYMISLPRDTRVNLLGGGTNKINSTYQGKSPMGNLQKTIKLNYNIDINAALVVNFNGFTNIVDKLGGVKMYVDEETVSIHHGYLNNNPNDHYKGYPYKINPNTGVPICSIPGKSWNNTNADECTRPGVKEVKYEPGWHTFSGYEALDYVRCRDGLPNTDYDRQRHQQQFIKAVMEQVYAKGLSDPLKLSGLISSLSNAFTFDPNGLPLTDWLFTLDKITPNNVITIKTNDGKFVTLPDDGHGSEQGLSADSQTLLADINTDTVGGFLATHPDWAAGG